jgi:hypothetical protein
LSIEAIDRLERRAQLFDHHGVPSILGLERTPSRSKLLISWDSELSVRSHSKCIIAAAVTH